MSNSISDDAAPGSPELFDSGLRLSHDTGDGRAVITVTGPLTFPDAAGLTGLVHDVVELKPTLAVLDLTGLDIVDATGLGVLMGICTQLTAAQVEIRVVAAEPRLRHRLPQCLRSQPIFFTVIDALASQR